MAEAKPTFRPTAIPMWTFVTGWNYGTSQERLGGLGQDKGILAPSNHRVNWVSNGELLKRNP